ncbi:uncharacterized protein TNCV_4528821 [Trichonephila clavipes]|nr:uncharacterized protein TNCV_4528821 [Trichonephila clavipes]
MSSKGHIEKTTANLALIRHSCYLFRFMEYREKDKKPREFPENCHVPVAIKKNSPGLCRWVARTADVIDIGLTLTSMGSSSALSQRDSRTSYPHNDQGYAPEIMDEILTTARNLELEVNEDDIEELIIGHEDELTTEELQEILNEEHQETHRNVSPE